MTIRVLVIGGYGNFGQVISKALALDPAIQVIIAGRSLEKAEAFARDLEAAHRPETHRLDIAENLQAGLDDIALDIVIHTSGPYQIQGYEVARACIARGCHYIDLADGREFVEEVASLNEEAAARSVLVISGASSVPCLTAALVDHYESHFKRLDRLDYGITTAQRTTRGLATTAAILSYTGKPFTTLIEGQMRSVYGWQGLRRRHYRKLGWRYLSHCNVPDLALFPKRYPDLRDLRFSAGIEIPLLHIGLWGLSWLARWGILPKLQRTAPLLLKTSGLFDRFGSTNSALHMELSGTDQDDQAKSITFELTAQSGDGPNIPCIPAILLAKKLARGAITQRGAYPCIGFIDLEEYLAALSGFDISWDEV